MTIPTTAIQILESAAAAIDRCAAQRDQPDGERSMRRAVEMFNAASGCYLTERDGNFFMCCLKIARSYATPNGLPDDYIDLAGYAALAGESAGKP